MRLLGIVLAATVTLLSRPVLTLAAEGAAAKGPQQLAVSPENLAAATRHFDEATQFYRAGKYDEARIEFEASFALSRDAELLHNLSLTAEKQGKLSDAIDFEERFLAAKPQSVTQRDSDEGRGRIMRLREQLTSAAAAPTQASSETVRPPMPASDRRRTPPGAIGLLAIGGAAVVVGIGCGAGAWATARTIDGMSHTVSEVDALTSRGQALDRAGIALDVVGAAALAAGAAWTLVERYRGRQTAVAGRLPAASATFAW